MKKEYVVASGEYADSPEAPLGGKSLIRNIFESMKVCGVNATDVRALCELGIPVTTIIKKNIKPEDLEQWCLDWMKDRFI